MIICKKCGYEALNASEFCPRCKNKIELTEREAADFLERLASARAKKEYEAVVEYYRILAWSGHTDSEREYGRMLEKGELVARDYDEAMKFFHRAAKKHDAYSAYRYSRLISRGNERAGRFWLLYSAVIGCPDAYPDAAKLLSNEGYDKEANHFYMLSAKHDDIDSIVEIASRYYKGIACSPSPEYAKWYMEKLSFPPLYALKLAYKLKGVISKEPPEELFDKEPLLRRLLAEAGKCGFKEAYFKLTSMLAELEDVSSMTVLGTLLIDGEGCSANAEEAVRIFTEAATLGSAEAYLCLANIFLSGEHIEKSPELAVRYLESASKLGSAEAFAMLGEIYESGEYFPKDYKKAEGYYRKAAYGGIAEAEVRAENIVKLRNSFFKDAVENKDTKPEKAFRALAIAAAMGHRDAPLSLADCYLKGTGVEADRRSAYFWYKEAVSLGDDRALYPLGLCLYMGVGVNRDFGKAKETLLKAARIGSEGAKIALKKLYEGKKQKLARSLYSRAMRLIYNKKFVEAKRSLELAFELDFSKACYILGCMYEFGLGAECDRETASVYYTKAYNLGFADTNAKYKKFVLKLIR